MGLQTVAQASENTVAVWLKEQIGAHKLVCNVSKGDTPFPLAVSGNEITVTAKGTERDETYSVSTASIYNEQLKITLVNDVDGPLAQDLLLLNVADVEMLSRGLIKTAQGWDVYSEQYDGTTQRHPMNCQIAE
jgi:hypothetical protein